MADERIEVHGEFPADSMTPGRSTVALALSGGNALGAYAAGAYEGLHQRGYLPGIVAGASIGAITGGLIAGNSPEDRVARLREFWMQAAAGSSAPGMAQTGRLREWYNAAHALQALSSGRPGLFFPSAPGVWSAMPGMPPDLAVLDHRPLIATLERLVDFERLNGAEVPLLISAVDLESGGPVLFDSRSEKLEPLHFLASTAFVPMFLPVEVGGRCLGDPGLMANLPIDAVLDPPAASDLLCFAVDLFDAPGPRPGSLDASAKRAQDILFASQSWRTLQARRREHRLRSVIRELQASLPPGKEVGSSVPELLAGSGDERITVVLIAYQTPPHELAAKTLDFSRASIEERWTSGLEDMLAAIEMLERDETRHDGSGFRILDCRRSTRLGSS